MILVYDQESNMINMVNRNERLNIFDSDVLRGSITNLYGIFTAIGIGISGKK